MIQVWTWPTPNGHKVHITLEELGLPVQGHPDQHRQRRPVQAGFPGDHAEPPHPRDRRSGWTWRQATQAFRVGRDHDLPVGKDRRQADPQRQRRPLHLSAMDDVPDGRHGSMFGQYNHFANYAVEKIPYAIERYTNEVKRLHRVLDKRLAQAEYLAGEEYSLADIINFPWIRNPDRRKYRSRGLSEREALARRSGGTSRGAARCGGFGGKKETWSHDRGRAGDHVRQDAISCPLAACRTRVSGLVRGVKVPVAEPSI